MVLIVSLFTLGCCSHNIGYFVETHEELYSEFEIFTGLEDPIFKFHRGAFECEQYAPQTTDTPSATGSQISPEPWSLNQDM